MTTESEFLPLFLEFVKQTHARADLLEARVKELEVRLGEVEKVAHTQVVQSDLVKRPLDFEPTPEFYSDRKLC